MWSIHLRLVAAPGGSPHMHLRADKIFGSEAS